jgi:hypothetical protein
VASIDLGQLGYLVVALFVAMWLLSFTVWKTAGIERRWAPVLDGRSRSNLSGANTGR